MKWNAEEHIFVWVTSRVPVISNVQRENIFFFFFLVCEVKKKHLGFIYNFKNVKNVPLEVF